MSLNTNNSVLTGLNKPAAVYNKVVNHLGISTSVREGGSQVNNGEILQTLSYEQFCSNGIRPASKVREDNFGRKNIMFIDTTTRGTFFVNLSTKASDLYDVDDIPQKSKVHFIQMKTLKDFTTEGGKVIEAGHTFWKIGLVGSSEDFSWS